MLPVFCILIPNSSQFSTQYSTNGMNTSSLKTNNLPPIFFTVLIININNCHSDGYKFQEESFYLTEVTNI